MLFKFKSQAASDLIMLEADARNLLKIILGDDPDRGIIVHGDLSNAIEALQKAVAQEAANKLLHADAASLKSFDEGAESVPWPPLVLAQRAAPLLKLFTRCQLEKSDVVWGV
jgi:hypothetical protein